jgi:hypothetical protein
MLIHFHAIGVFMEECGDACVARKKKNDLTVA